VSPAGLERDHPRKALNPDHFSISRRASANVKFLEAPHGRFLRDLLVQLGEL